MTAPLVEWTARLAAALWLARWLIEARSRSTGVTLSRPALACWTAGCLVHLAHVAAAFHFSHHGSLADAWRHTAQRTAAVTGLEWGGGLWLNLLFTLLWPLDVVRLRREQAEGRTSIHPRLDRAWHAFSLFMMVNATVVFGPPAWRWVGGIALLAWLVLRRRSVEAS